MFIELTDSENNKPVLIPVDNIAVIIDRDDNSGEDMYKTKISLKRDEGGDGYVFVRQSYEIVKAKINEATKPPLITN